MATSTHTHVLESLLEPVIGIKANRKTQARVAKLAEKCNEGTMSAEERREYETYVMASEFIAIFQAKAKSVLAKNV